MKPIQYLSAILCAGNLLSTMGGAEPAYREAFNNSNTSDIEVSTSGWQHASAGGTTKISFSNGVSPSSAGPNISQPNTSAAGATGYVYVYNTTSSLVHTSEYNGETPLTRESLESISFYQGHNAAGISIRVAIEIGGQWYASAAFAGPNVGGGTNFASMATRSSLSDFKSTDWNLLNVSGSGFALGSSGQSLPAGVIAKFGVFVSKPTASSIARFDQFEINRVPAYQEGFQNSTLVDIDLTSIGWQSASQNGTSMVAPGDGVAAEVTCPNAGQQDTSPAEDGGFIYLTGDVAGLLYTDEYSSEDRLNKRTLSSISFYQGHSESFGSARVALKIGAQWYAGPALVGPYVTAGNFPSQAVRSVLAEFDEANWTLLNPSGSTYVLGASGITLPPEDIDSFGLFATKPSAGTFARFDNIQIVTRPDWHPSSLIATTTDWTKIKLQWNASSMNNGFIIKRAANLSGPFSILASGVTANTYEDDSSVYGSNYYYSVTGASWQEQTGTAEVAWTPAAAGEIVKADNAAALKENPSWSGGLAPRAYDLAVWGNATLQPASRAAGLGGDISLKGLRIGNVGGSVTIPTGGTLTLGPSGLNLVSQNLIFQTPVMIGANQTWTIGTSRGLSIGSSLSGNEKTLTITGSGYMDILGSMHAYDGVVNYGASGRLRIRSAFEGTSVDLNITSNASVSAEATTGIVKIGNLRTSNTSVTLGNNDQSGSVTYEVGHLGLNSTWAGLIRNGMSNFSKTTSIRKVGDGVWNLSSANTYTGPTTVKEGGLMVSNSTGHATGTGKVSLHLGASLCGIGSVGGELVSYYGSSLTPGPGGGVIGSLSIQGPTTLEGTSHFVINRVQSPNSSRLNCAGNIEFSGEIRVANMGSTPQSGDSFTLFTASSFSGSIDALILPELPPGLVWNVADLEKTGVLKVGIAPTITAGPSDATVSPAGSASFSVSANGSQPLSYQWFVNGNASQNATGPNFTVTNVPTSQKTYQISVRVTNPFGESTAGAVLNLQDTSNPSFISHPQNTVVASGKTAILSVASTSYGPVTYQWYRGSLLLAGQTEASLHLHNVSSSDAGSYSVRITNSYGSVTSQTAQLTVFDPVANNDVYTLENGRLRLEFNKLSALSTVLDKNTGKSWLQARWTVPEGLEKIRSGDFGLPMGEYWTSSHVGIRTEYAGTAALLFNTSDVRATSHEGIPHKTLVDMVNPLELERRTHRLRYKYRGVGLRDATLQVTVSLFNSAGAFLGTVPASPVVFSSAAVTHNDWVSGDLWIRMHDLPGTFATAKLQVDVSAGPNHAGSLYLTGISVVDGGMIHDPSFKETTSNTGVKPWTGTALAGFAMIDDAAVTDGKVVRVDLSAAQTGSGVNRKLIKYGDSAARTYRISFRYKTEGVKNFTLKCRHTIRMTERAITFGSTAVTSGWQEYSYESAAAYGWDDIGFFFDFDAAAGAAGIFYLTDAEIVPVEPGVVQSPTISAASQVSSSKIAYSYNTVERTREGLPSLQCTLELGDRDENANELVWNLSSDPAVTMGKIYAAPVFMPADRATSVSWLVPSGEGLLLPGSDIHDPINNRVNPKEHNKLRPWTQLMPMAFHGGVTPQGDGYYLVNDTPVNTDVIYKPSQLSDDRYAYVPFLSHWGSKGKIHHPRKASIRFVGSGTSYVGIAKDYLENYAKPKGWHVTYADKAVHNPKLMKHIGAPYIYVIDNPGWEATEARLVSEFSAAGIDRATFRTINPANSAAAQNAGWITYLYDNYWDSIHPAFVENDWLKRDASGNVVNTEWGHKIVSTAFMEQVARQDIPIWNQNLNHECWFIDVFGTVPPSTDYKPGFPASEIDTLNARVEICKYIVEELGMVLWTEGAAEYLLPYASSGEGCLQTYGIPNADHKYRIPLWSLVYHDCWDNTSHTPDGNVGTEIDGNGNPTAYNWKTKDLYNVLYGSRQLFGFTVNPAGSGLRYDDTPGLKENVLKSIKEVTPATCRVGPQAMMDHKFVTSDGLVQMTRYADGTEVHVNFGESVYMKGSLKVPARNYVITQPFSHGAHAFWSGQTQPDGVSGTASALVSATNFAVPPTLSRTGSAMVTEGGALSFTDFEGTNWTGSGSMGTPGHSFGWGSGSTGNTLIIALNLSGLQDLKLRMDIRSQGAGKSTAFSSVSYSLDGGTSYTNTGIPIGFQGMTDGDGFFRHLMDLSEFDELDDQVSVLIRLVIPNQTTTSFFHVDNLQLSTTTALAETVYRELFNNTGSGSDLPVSAAGWSSYNSGLSGISWVNGVPAVQSGSNVGQSDNSAAVNSGYAYLTGTLTGLIHSGEYNGPTTLDSWMLDSISFHHGHGEAGVSLRVALEIGGQWFASPAFSGPNIGAGANFASQATQSVLSDFRSQNWTLLNPSGASYALVSPGQWLPRGKVSRFGVFITKPTSATYARFDNFVIQRAPLLPPTPSAQPQNMQLTMLTAAETSELRLQDSEESAYESSTQKIARYLGRERVSGTVSMPEAKLNGNFIEFTYTRSLEAKRQTKGIVEWSDDLTSQSWSQAGVQEQILGVSGDLESVRALVPKGAHGRRFVRLRVD